MLNEEAKSLILSRTASAIVRHIEPIFKPGVEITLIVRTPGNNEADILITSDTLTAVRGLLDRSEKRDATQQGGNTHG